MAFFEKKGSELLNLITTIDYSVANTYMTQIKPVATIVLSIFMLWHIIHIFLGSTKKPVNDIMIEMLVWSIVWTFAFTPTWIETIQDLMDKTYTWAGGGKQFFANLDKWYKELSTAGSTIYKLDTSYFPIEGMTAKIIITIGAFFVVVLPFFVIIGSTIVMQILLLLAPFMILTFIFPTLKKMFFNWIEQFLTLLMVVLIISLLQASLASNITKFVTNATMTITNGGKSLDLTATATTVLILCIIYGGMLISSVPIARSISGTWHTMKIGKTGL